MATKEIAVIGSLNVDFITRTPRIPDGGETFTANSFDTGFGGKGANQAVAAARLAPKNLKDCKNVRGAKVRMVGNVGDDSFGHDYIKALKAEGIDASTVSVLRGQKTGIANIIVEEDSGENRILLATGANHAFPKEESKEWDLVPQEADVVVFQLEIPIPVVCVPLIVDRPSSTMLTARQVLHNMHKAREMGKHIILNPAPAVMLPDFAYQDVDTLILNESEAGILAGPKAVDFTEDSGSNAYVEQYQYLAREFLKLGVRCTVVITLGSKGAVYATTIGDKGGAPEVGHQPAQKVTVVDTTAAGDTFVGAFAVFAATYGSVESSYVSSALEFATSAAAKTVGRLGAMASIPYLKDFPDSRLAKGEA